MNSTSTTMVLAQAVLKTANLLGLSNTQLAAVMGLDLMSMNQIEFSAVFEPTSSQGKTGLLLIRLYQSLSALTGDDSEWIDYFMNAFNTATDGVPIQQIQTRKGLEKVLTVVEALNNH
ncbi:antitoxin Xre/MbcA/ParS toxin-binding domain-containing protein [Acinetobacter junii]|uniref:antitoxin Xre/MbcA/ParS toxin-binding domain-containing protein n=1 Tax=Acinetobacter junii TaxID=40215 RepID=UPI003019AFCB